MIEQKINGLPVKKYVRYAVYRIGAKKPIDSRRFLKRERAEAWAVAMSGPTVKLEVRFT